MRISILFFLFVTGAMSSCYYDVEETLYPNTGDCITTNMSYQNDIIPILNASCMVCHSAAANLGNINLEGYDQLKTYVTNGRFLGSVRHDSGYSAMPQGGSKLSVCSISKIEQWILDGAPNN